MHELTQKIRCRALLLCVCSLISLVSSSVVFAQIDQHFIVGGRVVNTENQYPFMASVVLDSTGSNAFSHACGGSLIADRWVLTAAHCLYNSTFNRALPASRVGAWLGETDLVSRNGYFIRATRTILHPEYNPVTNLNDIALIELADPYLAERAVLPVKDSAVPLFEESGVVLGWGSVVEGGALSTKLREVSLPVTSDAACFPFYPDTFDSRYAFCAGGTRAGGEDSCQGDSGGPLLVTRDGTHVVAGLVSYGFGCGRSGIPGVYTRVEAYYDWIVSHTDGTVSHLGQQDLSLNNGTQVTRVALNTAVSGDVVTGEAVVFDVSGARQVNLTSNVGDADLYIIDGADLLSISAESVQCFSDAPPPLDVCVIDNQSVASFAVVYGYSDSNFTLSSQAIESSNGVVQVQSADEQSASQGDTNFTSGGGSGSLAGLLSLLLLLWFRRAEQS